MPFLGRLPDWIELYFVTCAWQTSVDWIVLGNDDFERWVGRFSNLHFLPLSVEQFVERAENVLGYRVRDSFHEKKVCDYRPIYGQIFSDLIAAYDYWGHVDHDLFVGNIGEVLLPYCDGRDVISTHHVRIAGPLSLYRNDYRVNQLWMKIANYREMLCDTERQYFCEEEHFARVVHDATAAGVVTSAFGVGNTVCDQADFKMRFESGRILRERALSQQVAESLRYVLHPLTRGAVKYWPVPLEFINFHFRLWKSSRISWNFDPYSVAGWQICEPALVPIVT